MKYELGGKIMTELDVLRPKKCVMKQKLKFEDYKHCLEATQLDCN